MTLETSTDQPWWVSFYDEWLEFILLDGAGATLINETTTFLRGVLDVQPGDLLFDQCCGNGRLSIPLAQQEFNVIGVDQATLYIERAKSRAAALGVDASFEAADAFDYVTPEPCDGVLNWWTSFGYAATSGKNVQMLRRAWESLKPGKKLALDFLNLPGIIRHFQPHVLDRRTNEQGEEVLMIRESRMDFEAGILHKDWTYVLPDGQKQEHQTQVKMYMPDQLGQLLEDAGFHTVEFYGGVDASPLTVDSRRCIVVATK